MSYSSTQGVTTSLTSLFREIFKENAKFASRVAQLFEQYEDTLKSKGYADNDLLEVKAAKKKKRKRGKDEPKKPLSSYMLFAQEHRPQVVKDNENANFTEIGKILGVKWKALSHERKDKYKKAAERERAKYKQLLEDNERQITQALAPKIEAEQDNDNKEDTSSESDEESGEEDDNTVGTNTGGNGGANIVGTITGLNDGTNSPLPIQSISPVGGSKFNPSQYVQIPLPQPAPITVSSAEKKENLGQKKKEKRK